VHQHGLRVVVAKACFSGCAQFVFAAARERVILPDSLVVFHNTRSSIARLGVQLRSPDTDDFQRAADADAALEQKFYAELGLVTALLYEPQLEVNTICVRFARDPQGRARDLEFKSSFIGWVPTRSLMTQAGLTFSGFWPDNPLTFHHAFGQVFRKDWPYQLKLSLTDHLMSAAEIDAAYAKIRLCDSSQTK
jgi:hypothetical protein